jgi:protein kinase-like protein/tetratricopeptide repeat protein
MCTLGTAALCPAVGYDGGVGTRETLRSIVEASRSSKRLDELGAAHLISKVAEQLHAAHQKAGAGKAVGPITPAAIVVGEGGAIELSLADRGHAIGYSAPETLAGSADRRSDVFSLGIVMWEVLTHQRLFEAMNDAAAKIAVKEREIKPPAEVNANVPAELATICMRALSRNPAERYGSAKAMGVEIEEFLSEAGYDGGDAKLAAYVAQVVAAKPEPVKPAEPAKADEPQTLKDEPAQPAPVASGLPPIESVAAFAPPVTPKPPILPDKLPENPKATIAAAVPPMPAHEPAPVKDTIPDGQIAQSLKAEERHAAAPQPVASTGSAPHPASVVSLPHPGRDSRSDVLSSWAWQTDSVEAIHDDDDLHAMHSSRKPLLYVIGGGLALTAIVTIIAVGFGGSSDKKKEQKPQPVATTMEGSADRAMSASAPGSAERASGAQEQVAVTGSGTETGTATGSGSATDTGSAAVAGSATATGSAATGSAAVAVTPPEPVKPEPVKPEPVKEPEPKKTETKVTKTEPPKTETKTAKTETKTAKTEAKTTKTQKGQLADPFTGGGTPKKTETKVATADKKSGGPKVDVETAYRVGLQQFARGDTTGALASLRTSLASNPNYPPTWRGLGLVFEKLGEKDQARAAYKRYLQLAPNAGDAEQIRGRLERLGT